MVGEFGLGAGPRGDGVGREARRLADALGRLHPGQHRALRRFGPGQVGGQQAGQPVAGILQQVAGRRPRRSAAGRR